MPYKCNVCGRDFELMKSLHYISRNGEVVLSGLSALAGSKEDEPTIYDSFDCPFCGCQNVIQERKRISFDEMSNIQEVIDYSIAKQVEQSILNDTETAVDGSKELPSVKPSNKPCESCDDKSNCSSCSFF